MKFYKNFKKNFRGAEFAELAFGLSLGPTAWGSEKLVHRNMFLPPIPHYEITSHNVKR
jgi:hypothetical protein